MAEELRGKGAIVTGGASGIGRATVLALAQAGAKVAVLDRDEGGVRATVELVQKSGGEAIAVAVDLAKTTEIESHVNSILKQLGRIDMLIFFWDPLAAQPHDPDVKALLRVAVVANVPVACNRATADYLMASAFLNDEHTKG